MGATIRLEFPVTDEFSYLNTASVGVMPRSTIDSVRELYARYLTRPPAPDIFDEYGEKIEGARSEFARWIGARETGEEISFQPNSSTSLNFVAAMVAPKKGENVVVDDLGFPSGTFPLMALERKGIEVRWVKNQDGLITASDYEKSVDSRTRLVIVSLVSWVNGLRAEVEEISRIAHEREALCMVDSTHGTGYLDIDVRRWNVDFLTTSNYKWLLASHGASEFYCSGEKLEEFEPPHLGWHSADSLSVHELSAERLSIASTARRFEPGSPDYVSILTLMESLRFLSRIGRREIEARTLKLSKMVNEGLRNLGMDVLTPVEEERHLSGIVFAHSKRKTGDETARKLGQKGVIVTPRFYHGLSGIRVSPYFYNDERDVERLLGCLRDFLSS